MLARPRPGIPQQGPAFLFTLAPFMGQQLSWAVVCDGGVGGSAGSRAGGCAENEVSPCRHQIASLPQRALSSQLSLRAQRMRISSVTFIYSRSISQDGLIASKKVADFLFFPKEVEEASSVKSYYRSTKKFYMSN